MGLSLTFPEKLRATITLPGSKSIAARALILSALSGGRQVLNLSDCDDTQALLKALTHDTEIVDIGAAGTAMRFLTAYFATQSGTQHLLTGTERMQQRPISILVEALQTLAKGTWPILMEEMAEGMFLIPLKSHTLEAGWTYKGMPAWKLE